MHATRTTRQAPVRQEMLLLVAPSSAKGSSRTTSRPKGPRLAEVEIRPVEGLPNATGQAVSLEIVPIEATKA